MVGRQSVCRNVTASSRRPWAASAWPVTSMVRRARWAGWARHRLTGGQLFQAELTDFVCVPQCGGVVLCEDAAAADPVGFEEFGIHSVLGAILLEDFIRDGEVADFAATDHCWHEDGIGAGDRTTE